MLNINVLVNIVGCQNSEPLVTYAVLDSAHKGTGLVLSNGNLTATGNVVSNAVLANTAVTGARYWEFTPNVGAGVGSMVGLATVAANVETYLGGDASGWSYYNLPHQKYHSAGAVNYGTTFTSANVVGIAYDAVAGTLEFFVDNVSKGVAYTGLVSGLYPAFGTASDNANDGGTFNFGATPMVYAPPEGFTAGVY